jgi:hypothetical protein
LSELAAIHLRRSLEEVIFPPDSRVVLLGDGAFESSALTSICIPTSVHAISKDSCAFCHRAVNVEFEVGCRISDFGDGAFSDSASLQTISIPTSAVAFIDKHCSFACNELLTVSF